MPQPSTDTTTLGRIRHPSRGPVAVLIIGGVLAVSLVLLGAQLASTPVGAPAAATPGTAEMPRDLNVILHDFRFEPTPLYLFPGETVRLNIINGGLVEHEFVLGDAGVQDAWARADAVATPPAPFATPPVASAEPQAGGIRVLLGSGESTSVVYHVPTGGEPLQLMCHLPGHLEKGMIGQVELLSR